MKQIITLVFLIFSMGLVAQRSVPSGQRNTGPLTSQDADVLRHIEEAKLPDNFRSFTLPDSIDNSQSDWFRPIFSQLSFPNCMQSTSIAYNFTYEMCRLRGLSAQTEDNQYGTHFAWNFFNGGRGWYGVNYLQTMDVLMHHGVPTVTEYGGFYYGEGERWMSGYDEYYSAMNNRISRYRKIFTGSEEGILTLKHWLANHLDGSETGGVASFIASSAYGLQSLPEGTPNAGKKVMITFYPSAEHGMTIVGYNDSIRWDYNNDGQYTNHLDINGDGIVSPKDWEIGAFKFANSHGVYFGDSGFAYMMYKTLVDEFEHGGIWESCVHILDVKEEHHTQMTFKVAMEHDYRQRIRVQVGLNENLESSVPEHIHSYTIFNFQGGQNYMAGVDTTPDNKLIEFGLDVSSLLSYTEPGKPYKFFLIIDENDPENIATGKVNYFSLMDYQNGFQEIACSQENIPLQENGRTLLSVIHTPEFNPPVITNSELPVYEPGQSMEVQLNAQGGEAPYTWSLDQNYTLSQRTADFPMINENQIIDYDYNESRVVQQLDFSFPFYGNIFDSVIVSSSGFVAFDDQMYFWSYIVDNAYFLKNMRVVSPFLSEQLQIFNEEYSGLWYEGDEHHATFRWETGIFEGAYGGVNFALTLYPNGEIEFHYGDIYIEDDIQWTAGISNGDLVNNSLPILPLDPNNIVPGTYINFLAPQVPQSVQLNKEGMLSVNESEENVQADIRVIVTDNTKVSANKVFNYTDGLEIILSVSGADNNGSIQSGKLNLIDLHLRNRSNAEISDISIIAALEHPLLSFVDDKEQIDFMAAGETKEIPAAFSCVADVNMSNREVIPVYFECEATGFSYEKQLLLSSIAPDIQINHFKLLSENGILETGGEAKLRVDLVNLGMEQSMNTHANLRCSNPGITIHDAGPINLGDIDAGGTASIEFDLTAGYAFENGSIVSLYFNVRDKEGRIMETDLEIMVGKIPVCVVDMDPNSQSGPKIFELLQQMEVSSIYTSAFPENFSGFQSVFLCLGTQFSFHELNWGQAVSLRNYLDDGGDLYMEGRNIWTQGDISFLLEKFNINTSSLPGLYPIVEGVDSTFTAGLAFETFMAQPYNSFHLEPIPPAYSILRGREYPYCISAAYDAGNYQTVAMVFELGSYLSSDTSNLEDMVQGILDFFGVVESSLSLEEIPGFNYANVSQNYPNPFTTQTRIPLELDAPAFVEAAVFDLRGRRIYELQNPAKLAEGNYLFNWNAKDYNGNPVPGGIYIYRISVDGMPLSGKMILIR